VAGKLELVGVAEEEEGVRRASCCWYADEGDDFPLHPSPVDEPSPTIDPLLEALPARLPISPAPSSNSSTLTFFLFLPVAPARVLLPDAELPGVTVESPPS